MNSKPFTFAILSAALLLACNKGEQKPAAESAAKPADAAAPAASAESGSAGAARTSGFDPKKPCAAFTEDIAALISSPPFRPPMENANYNVSMCNRTSQNPGAGDHGAFARFESMSKESFAGRNCLPPNEQNGMEGYTLETLAGVGEAACLYQSKTPTFATALVYAHGHSIQVGNGSREKLVAALEKLLPKLQ